MKRIGLAALIMLSLTSAHAETVRYQISGRIKGPDGGWDLLAVDSDTKRLYVARSYGVMMVDLASGTVADKLVEGAGVHGVLLLPGTSLAMSTNGKSNDAVLFDRSSGNIVSKAPTGNSPDALVVEPKTGLVVVFNAKSADATLYDPATRTVIGGIALDGKPELGVADGSGQVFVNLEDKAAIAVIDVAGRKVTSRYALPGCEEPTGLGFDAKRGILIAACANKVAKVIDAATGNDLGSLPIGKGADGLLIDTRRRRALIPAGDGTLTVLDISGSGPIVVAATVATQAGARTAALDEQTGSIYLPTAKFAEPEKAGDRRKPIPGTFEVLVVTETH
jgi:DNA-binding beta-propeller fold protein YncE